MPIKIPHPQFSPKVKQQIRIRMKPAIEETISPPIELPTSPPTTGQFYRTITQADMPETLPPANYVPVAIALISGINNNPTSVTVYVRMVRNGSIIATGSVSVPANYHWRAQAFFLGVAEGDTIELRAWATASNVTIDYRAFQIQPSRLYTDEMLNRPCTIEYQELSLFPIFTDPNAPGLGTNGSPYIYSMDYYLTTITSSASFEAISPRPNFRLFRIYYGDATSSNTLSFSTASSRSGLSYLRNYIPTVINATIYI